MASARVRSRAEKEGKKADKESSSSSQKAAKKVERKSTSNVFSLFSQPQIQEFKEAFTIMDQNRDGFIDIDDLKDLYVSLGRNPDEKVLKSMVDEAPGPLNFTMFLTLFGDKMKGTDPESTLRDAFTMFDENKTGKIEENYMKHLLTEVGDLFTKDEVKLTWKEAPIEGGQMDYLMFVQYIKRGKEGED